MMLKELVKFVLEKYAHDHKHIIRLDPVLTWAEEMESGDILYGFDDSNSRPEHFLQYWICQNGQIEERPSQQYIDNANIIQSQGSYILKFSIVEESSMAYIIWMSSNNASYRPDIQFGVYFFEKVNDHWQENPKLHQFGRS